MLTMDYLTHAGAALYNAANAAIATLAVRQALAMKHVARPIDVVLCDPDVQAEYLAACPVAQHPLALLRERERPALRLVPGGGQPSLTTRERPVLRVLRGGVDQWGGDGDAVDVTDGPEAG